MAALVTLRRVDVGRYRCADRVYEILLDGVRIGEVARDDVLTDGPRHIWHGWLDEFPGADEAGFGGGWDEAAGNRVLTRGEAVWEVLDEFRRMSERLGVAPPWGEASSRRPL